MDKEKIFGLFDDNFDENLQKEIGSYKKSFHFKIGMFIKVVIYGDKWKNSVVSMFSKANTDFVLVLYWLRLTWRSARKFRGAVRKIL